MTVTQERIIASDDTWIDSTDPTANHGSDVDLPITSEPPDEKSVILSFDTGHTTGTVTNAKLHIFIIQVAEIPMMELRIGRLYSNFEEDTATWLTTGFGQTFPFELAWNIDPQYGGVRVSIDISQMVQDAIDDNDGILNLKLRSRTIDAQIAIKSHDATGASTLKPTLYFDIDDQVEGMPPTVPVVKAKVKPPSKTKARVKKPNKAVIDIDPPAVIEADTEAPNIVEVEIQDPESVKIEDS